MFSVEVYYTKLFRKERLSNIQLKEEINTQIQLKEEGVHVPPE